MGTWSWAPAAGADKSVGWSKTTGGSGTQLARRRSSNSKDGARVTTDSTSTAANQLLWRQWPRTVRPIATGPRTPQGDERGGCVRACSLPAMGKLAPAGLARHRQLLAAATTRAAPPPPPAPTVENLHGRATGRWSWPGPTARTYRPDLHGRATGRETCRPSRTGRVGRTSVSALAPAFICTSRAGIAGGVTVHSLVSARHRGGAGRGGPAGGEEEPKRPAQGREGRQAEAARPCDRTVCVAPTEPDRTRRHLSRIPRIPRRISRPIKNPPRRSMPRSLKRQQLRLASPFSHSCRFQLSTNRSNRASDERRAEDGALAAHIPLSSIILMREVFYLYLFFIVVKLNILKFSIGWTSVL